MWMACDKKAYFEPLLKVINGSLYPVKRQRVYGVFYVYIIQYFVHDDTQECASSVSGSVFYAAVI